MSKPVAKYWVNRHSMVDEHSAMRTSSDIPMYMASDVDALLRQREDELEKRMYAYNKLRDGYDESIAQLQAQLAAMVEQRAQDGLDGQAALDMLNNQLSTSQARCAEAIEALHALYDVQMWWAVGKGE